MSARRTYGPKGVVSSSTCIALIGALIVLGGAAARAETGAGNPFSAPPPAPGQPVTPAPGPSAQAPAAAPPPTTANFIPGPLEQLPSTAYPEPYVRGLYGSSLWLNMQGLQWPYYPRTGIGVSGYGWLDTDYKHTRIGDVSLSPYTTKYFQQGRFLLRVTPTYTNGNWFIQAQGELVANKDQINSQPNLVDTDDIWVRVGVWKRWDVTVGRFEAFEVYHLGMGLDINTDERIGAYDTNTLGRVTQLYGATFMFYRPAGPGNIALHLYPIKQLRIELLSQWGNDGNVNYIGERPAVIFDIGILKLKAAAEYLRGNAVDPGPMFRNDQTKRGFAGSAQVVLAPWVEFGPNIGYAIIDVEDANSQGENTGLSGNEISYGGFVNARVMNDLLVGAGVNYASFHNLHQNAAGEYDRSSNMQSYVAVQYLLFHQLFLKLVGGYAKSHFENSFSNMVPYDDDMFSVRLRVMYLF